MNTRVFAALALAISVAAPATAKSIVLQTVNLNDREMSTEGGEATLYRVTSAKGAYCRIEAIHYGETGKAVLGFAFNPRLFSAVMRQYRYNLPIYWDGGGKVASVHTVTLETKEGAAHLPADFKEYLTFFDGRQLAKCSQH